MDREPKQQHLNSPQQVMRPVIVRQPAKSKLHTKLPGAALAVVFLGLAGIVGVRAVPPGSILNFAELLGFSTERPDRMNEQERNSLAAAYLAQGPVELPRVKLRELNAALASMALTPAQETLLREDLALAMRASGRPNAERIAQTIATPAARAAPAAAASGAVAPVPGGAPTATSAAVPAPALALTPPPVSDAARAIAAPPQPTPAAPASVAPAPAAPALAAPPPRPAPVSAAAVPSPQPLPQPALDDDVDLPLAWLTLWDHRDEDGDIVRVVSEGYARSVPILHVPVTLAVPVPASGVINIVGVHDGFGGITVGIKSGATPVLLPVLSVGQVVGVPVLAR